MLEINKFSLQQLNDLKYAVEKGSYETGLAYYNHTRNLIGLGNAGCKACGQIRLEDFIKNYEAWKTTWMQ